GAGRSVDGAVQVPRISPRRQRHRDPRHRIGRHLLRHLGRFGCAGDRYAGIGRAGGYAALAAHLLVRPAGRHGSVAVGDGRAGRVAGRDAACRAALLLHHAAAGGRVGATDQCRPRRRGAARRSADGRTAQAPAGPGAARRDSAAAGRERRRRAAI
ncbi:hypothetical protein LTR94_032475, partial [Friedmanniomyces endolithicus]